jgi:hypothetical protein
MTVYDKNGTGRVPGIRTHETQQAIWFPGPPPAP